MSRDPEPEVHEVFATIADDRSREEREAWVAFAAGYNKSTSASDAAAYADCMIFEYRKRFPVGGAE